jgi:hypothetical protein
MLELTGNLHIHTGYSDGELYHAALASAAARAGLDFLITTDHNVFVGGVDRWIDFAGGRRVLVLAGEEIHHQDRIPQKNHLLALGVRKDLSRLASDPQTLLNAVCKSGGAAFLAHPYDPAAPLVHEEALGWIAWAVRGYSGLEIWNYMSEFKSLLHRRRAMLFYALFPSLGIRGPDEATLKQWDRLLADGGRVAAIGGSDAHGHAYAFGPLRKTVFSYEYLFRTVTMHILVEKITGSAETDGRSIVDSIKKGSSWIAYDLSKPSRGFEFRAEGNSGIASLGGELTFSSDVVLKASLPAPAEWKIIQAGRGPVQCGFGTHASYSPSGPGAYRLEAYRRFRGRMRGWIFTNPIYLVIPG